MISMLRHVITAGHCICNLKHDKNQKRALCMVRPTSGPDFYAGKDQIKSKYNEMFVYGGSKSVENFSFTKRWTVDEAYTVTDTSRTSVLSGDIGILVLSPKRAKQYLFFDRDLLMDKNELGRAVIVPICLTSVDNTNIQSKTLRGVGWGRQYDESPEKEPGHLRKTIYSSCMTSAASPFFSRYQNCDMEKIQQNGWLCETFIKHPGYDRKCVSYRNLLKSNRHSMPSFAWEKLLDTDMMYIIDSNKKKTTCYSPYSQYEENPGLVKPGWCYLKDGGIGHWGMCSKSCNEKLMRV